MKVNENRDRRAFRMGMEAASRFGSLPPAMTLLPDFDEGAFGARVALAGVSSEDVAKLAETVASLNGNSRPAGAPPPQPSKGVRCSCGKTLAHRGAYAMHARFCRVAKKARHE